MNTVCIVYTCLYMVHAYVYVLFLKHNIKSCTVKLMAMFNINIGCGGRVCVCVWGGGTVAL